MAIDVSKIVKEGNNVLLKDASDNLIAVVSSQGTYAHKNDCDDITVYLSSKPTYREPIDFKYNIDVTKITEPVGVWTQSTLLQELADNYLNCPYIIDSLTLGEIKIILEDLYTFQTEESNIRLADNVGHTVIPSSLTSVLLEAQEPNRRELTITNDSTSNLFVKKGSAASISNYSYKLKAGDVVHIDDYRGNVYGIWDIVNGNAVIAETF